jgi:hypothetical protein
VFLSEVQGSVAKATHAGLPWLRRIKMAVGREAHFWPFDGWKVPEGRSVSLASWQIVRFAACRAGMDR